MLNWDEPLAPLKARTTEPAPAMPAVDPVPPLQEIPRADTRIDEKRAEAPAPKPSAPSPSAEMPASAKPINPEDKRVVNGLTDINQLAPFKYPWAWEYFLNANKNHWTPLDINMTQDVHDFQHKLTLEERHVYENVLSYLTTSDILAMRRHRPAQVAV